MFDEEKEEDEEGEEVEEEEEEPEEEVEEEPQRPVTTELLENEHHENLFVDHPARDRAVQVFAEKIGDDKARRLEHAILKRCDQESRLWHVASSWDNFVFKRM